MLEVCSVSHCSVGRLRPAERGDSGASGRRHTIASSYARHCVLYLSVQRHYPCMLCWGFPRVIQRTVLIERTSGARTEPEAASAMFTQSSKPSSTPTKHSGFAAPNGPRTPTCSYCERTNTTHTIEQCRDRLNGLPRGGGNRRRSGSYKPDTNGSPSDEGRPAERKGAANLVVTTDNLFSPSPAMSTA